MDTIRDAVREPEFVTGFRAGLVALGVAVLLGLAWRLTLRGAKPPPIGGAIAAAACTYALRDAVPVPDRVVLAVVLLGAAGLIVDVLRWPTAFLLGLGAPGAVLLASEVQPANARWVELVVGGTALVGGMCVTSFDRRWAGHGLGLPLVALWAFGAYTTLPDTEGALAELGVLAVVAVAAWPLRLTAVGASGAMPLAGLIAWNAAYGGFGRDGSIVGAVACTGLLAIEPVTRRLSNRSPIDLLARPERTRWWTLVAVAPVHLALVFLAGRVAGLEDELRSAMSLVIAIAAAALVVSLLLAFLAVSVARRAQVTRVRRW